MKKILSISFLGLILFAGCKEKDPAVGLTSALSTDSAWVMASVPATDPHNVMIEEFSGQSCPNCPGGHATIESNQALYPGRINAVVMYPYGSPDAIPPTGSAYNFEDSFANNLSAYVTGGGIRGLPSTYIDRVVYQGNNTQEIDGTGTWPTDFGSQLLVTDSVNLAVQSSFNKTTTTATITATVIYTKPLSSKQNLSIVIVEDTIYNFQKISSGAVDSSYLFTDVFRGMVSSIPAGDPILDTIAVKQAGQAYKRTYIYTLPATSPAIVPKHCRVIAFINSVNGSDYHVMQSAQTSLTGL